mgnify:CR=1 FL=1
MTRDADTLRRGIVRKCLRKQFDVPLPGTAGMTEDEAVEAAMELIDKGFVRLEQTRVARAGKAAKYRLVPVAPAHGGRQ